MQRNKKVWPKHKEEEKKAFNRDFPEEVHTLYLLGEKKIN